MRHSVIFTDIDGVLTTERTKFHAGDKDCVARLNRLAEETDAAVVVSSTWRLRGAAEIENILRGWGVMCPLRGVTPDLSREKNGVALAVERGDEIGAWLAAHPDVQRFVILDDDNDMAELTANLVLTDSYIGLQEKDVESARALLLFE